MGKIIQNATQNALTADIARVVSISPKAIIGVVMAVAFIAIDNATLSKKNAEWEAEQIEKYGDALDNIAKKSEEKKDELFEASESRKSEVSALAEALGYSSEDGNLGADGENESEEEAESKAEAESESVVEEASSDTTAYTSVPYQ